MLPWGENDEWMLQARSLYLVWLLRYWCSEYKSLKISLDFKTLEMSCQISCALCHHVEKDIWNSVLMILDKPLPQFLRLLWLSGRSKKLWRSIANTNGERKSRQIPANRGKFHSENNGDHFFKKSWRIASYRSVQKRMAIILEVKFWLILVCTIFVNVWLFFFLIQGIGGGWVLVCLPPSLYQTCYQIFLNLSQYFSVYKGFKILKSDKIQTFQIDYLSHFLISGGTMIKIIMHSVKKIPLLDFSIQRLWWNFLKISRSFSIILFFQNKF